MLYKIVYFYVFDLLTIKKKPKGRYEQSTTLFAKFVSRGNERKSYTEANPKPTSSKTRTRKYPLSHKARITNPKY